MPSSRFLIDRLLQPIDFAKASVIVQLGIGTGCIMRALLARMNPGCRLICVEVDSAFIEACSGIDDPRVTVAHRCATDLRAVLQIAGVREVDHIVSTVPLSLLDDPTADEILDVAHGCLRPGGKFLQYQYSLNYLQRLTKRYGDVHWGFTLRNVPPAFSYECIKSGALPLS